MYNAIRLGCPVQCHLYVCSGQAKGKDRAVHQGHHQAQGRGDLFKDDYQDLIARLKRLPTAPKVYVVLPPPLYPWTVADGIPLYPYNMSAHAINVEFPKLQREVADASRADGLIDVWSAMMALGGANVSRGPIVDGAPLTCDGCHPKDAGLTIIAETIAQAIRNDAAKL